MNKFFTLFIGGLFLFQANAVVGTRNKSRCGERAYEKRQEVFFDEEA